LQQALKFTSPPAAKTKQKRHPCRWRFCFCGYITDPVTAPAIDLGTLPD